VRQRITAAEPKVRFEEDVAAVDRANALQGQLVGACKLLGSKDPRCVEAELAEGVRRAGLVARQGRDEERLVRVVVARAERRDVGAEHPGVATEQAGFMAERAQER
jgi:hypothetical protein